MDDVFSPPKSANALISEAAAKSGDDREVFLQTLQRLIRHALDNPGDHDWRVIAEAIGELTPPVKQTPSEVLIREGRDER